MSTHVEPKVDLKQYKHLYVEHRLADGRGLDALMAKELQSLGYDAAYGPVTLMPKESQIIISYEDRWTWDFTSYMIELDVTLRDARSGKYLGYGRYSNPTFRGNSSDDMIHKVLVPLFKRS